MALPNHFCGSLTAYPLPRVEDSENLVEPGEGLKFFALCVEVMALLGSRTVKSVGVFFSDKSGSNSQAPCSHDFDLIKDSMPRSSEPPLAEVPDSARCHPSIGQKQGATHHLPPQYGASLSTEP